jgi:zinc transporter, ZIP family
MSATSPSTTKERFIDKARPMGLALIPVVVLAGVILLFLVTNGAGLHVAPVVPQESVSFERTVLQPGAIDLHLRNMSSQGITIAALNINDTILPFRIEPGATIPRLGKATIHLTYPWVKGEAYNITLFTSNSIPFTTAIAAATSTAAPSSKTLLSYTLIGLYVGIIPVLLGITWFPALKLAGKGTFLFLMAITTGILIFLGIDATNEALETAQTVGGAFQGVGLVGIGIVLTFLLLDAITRWQVSIGRGEVEQRLNLASTIAVGIGLHNLGEGLAIGASFSVGAAALGTFLVIGFIIQNITEGLGIIAPIVKDNPSLKRLILMGIIGGAPAILGTWIGGFTSSQPLTVLFLAIGAGAVFEVAYEVFKLLQRSTAKQPRPLTIFGGVMVGMLMLYITGLLVK